MKKWTKFVCMLILFATIVSMVACGKRTSGNEESGSAAGTVDNIVEDKRDFNEYVFRVMTEECPFQHYAFDSDSDGSKIGKALIDRNRKIEEDYNIFIVDVPVELGSTNETIRTSIMADDRNNKYDLLFGMGNWSFRLITEGCYVDLKTMDELDLSASCWDQNAVQDLSVKNHLFCVTGDIHFGAYDMVSLLLCNKNLLSDLTLEEDPTDLAIAGTWTYETMGEMMEVAKADLDGTSNENSLEDRYGLASTTACYTNFMVGAGISFFEKDSADVPAFTKNTMVFSDVYDSMLRLTTTANSYVLNDQTDSYRECFKTGHSLFLGGIVWDLSDPRTKDCNFKYSPVPFPKLTKEQTRYYSSVNFQTELMFVPVGGDLNIIGAITQSLCRRSTDTLRKNYYEEVLKLQEVSDPRDSAVLDIIYDTRCYDIGLICLWGSVRSVFNNELAGKHSTSGVGFFIASYGASANVDAQNFIKLFEKYENSLESNVSEG